MRALDRMIKSERRQKYKLLRKSRKARDAASKYIERQIKLKEVWKFYSKRFLKENFISVIAKDIVDRRGKLERIRPPIPPANTKPSITILSPNPPKGPEPVVRRRK